MRILYVGNSQGFNNAGKYYLIPQKIINGFTRLGHTVYPFNDRDIARHSNLLRSQKFGAKATNEKLLKTVKEYQPDLIVLGHCTMIQNDTLSEIRALIPNVRIIYRNVDPLHEANNVQDIKTRCSAVDAVFVTTAGKSLDQFSNNNSKVYYFPNPIDQSIETFSSCDQSSHEIDILFLGSALRHSYDHRVNALNALQSALPDQRTYFGGRNLPRPPIYGAAYMSFLNQSRIGLCLNKTEDYLYSSDRMSHYLGCGLLTVIHQDSHFVDILGNDAIVTYADLNELIEKVSHYAHNDNEWRIIARNGRERGHKMFGTEKICQYMIDMAFHGQVSQPYDWPTDAH